jgi:hypothetical protein
MARESPDAIQSIAPHVYNFTGTPLEDVVGATYTAGSNKCSRFSCCTYGYESSATGYVHKFLHITYCYTYDSYLHHIIRSTLVVLWMNALNCLCYKCVQLEAQNHVLYCSTLDVAR